MTATLATIGHNNAPGPLVFGSETMTALSDWMADHPVIATQSDAKEAKLLADRARNAIEDMESERDGLVRPINEQVAIINGRYRVIRDPLMKVLSALKERLTKFARAEELKRMAEAEAKRKAAEEAERLAREAEARERELHDNASVGEVGCDIGWATTQADQAFAAFTRADRAAARAEKDTKVRITGGFNRNFSLRSHEVLTITNVHEAIDCIGLTDKIRDAILSSARDYRKQFDELPDGIGSESDRRI